MIPPEGLSMDELVRRLIVILGIAAIVAVSTWILAPFLPAVLWAATIAIASWPLLQWVQARLGGRRWAATGALTLALLLGFFVPLILMTHAFASRADDAAALAEELAAHGLPPVPAALERVPLAGPRLAAAWAGLAQLDGPQLRERLEPALRTARHWLLGRAGGLLHLTLQLVLAVIVTALFYARGETAAAGVRAFLRRLGGDTAERLGLDAAGAARAVALGVVVTAVLQAVIAALALSWAGVPGAVLIGGIMLVLCLAQVGPLFVMLPAAAWLAFARRPGAAVAMLAVLVGLMLIDNLLKPLLITRSAKLPLLLVFLGVVGGMLGFGVIGIFVGPVVLGVTWTLMRAWVGGGPATAGSEGAGRPA
ncbi:MAG: AI-2E family transporter [Gemmatimonadales bacterium]|nr:AI-2E family transporter [Gemmatimonadales bacterium]